MESLWKLQILKRSQRHSVTSSRKRCFRVSPIKNPRFGLFFLRSCKVSTCLFFLLNFGSISPLEIHALRDQPTLQIKFPQMCFSIAKEFSRKFFYVQLLETQSPTFTSLFNSQDEILLYKKQTLLARGEQSTRSVCLLAQVCVFVWLTVLAVEEIYRKCQQEMHLCY